MPRLGPGIVVAVAALVLSAGCAGGEPVVETASAGASGVRVRYLANEGVLIAGGGTEIMIDGLQRGKASQPYDVLRGQQRERIENARAPWSGVDLVLVSHLHLDHFHRDAVARFLRSAPGAQLVTSAQVVGELEGSGRARVRSIAWRPGKSQSIRVAGASVTFLGLRHSAGSWPRDSVQNFGHLVEVAGIKVLHVGDADASVANFAPFRLPARRIDLALVPWWFLETQEGRNVIRHHIAARKVALFHAAQSEVARARELIARHAPGAVVLARPLADQIDLAVPVRD
jgi:L-ascorbate metabolism protein UlaG (beta-lactamase superfamily)